MTTNPRAPAQTPAPSQAADPNPTGNPYAESEKKPPFERKDDAPQNFTGVGQSRAQNAGAPDAGKPGREGNAGNIGSPEYFLQALAGDGSSMRVWQMMDAPGRFVLVKRNHSDISGVGLIELEEGMSREEADERLRRAFDGSAVLV